MTDPRITIVRAYTDVPYLNNPPCVERAAALLRELDAHAAAQRSASEVERVARAAFAKMCPLACDMAKHEARRGHMENRYTAYDLEETFVDAWKAALSAMPPRDDLTEPPCKLCPHVLACSRCGEPVARDYEPGLCKDGDDSPENGGDLDVHDQAEPYHEVNGPCSPPHSSKPVARVSRLVGGPNDSGWYYHDEGCPDEGAVGPFETRDEAEAHAHCGGYRLEGRTEDQPADVVERAAKAVRDAIRRLPFTPLGQTVVDADCEDIARAALSTLPPRDDAERFVEFVRNLRNLPVTYFDTIWNELDRLDAARKAKP